MPSNFTSCSSLSSYTMRSTSMRLYDNECNAESITIFDLSAMKLLTSIIIGNDNMYYTNTFMLNNMLYLKSLTFGGNAFTQYKNHHGDNRRRSFHILNCELLQSISIGQHSFSDYSGDFELFNLPLLQTLQIGFIDRKSSSFYYSNFQLSGGSFVFY